MKWSIIWSPKAKAEYFSILDYLQEVWGESSVHGYIDKVERVLSQLLQQPFIVSIY